MRPRKHNKHLPRCVYLRHGTYYYVRQGKWIPLGRELGKALSRYARLLSVDRADMVGIIDQTIERAREKGRSPDTLRQYEIAGNHLKKALVEFAVDEVEPHHVGDLMDHFADRPNMANRMLSLLRMAFNVAIRKGLRERNPTDNIEKWPEGKRHRYLDDAEWRAIYTEASPPLQCMMDVAYYTGQRISDVLAIRQSDVTDEGVYFEPKKTRKQGKKVLVEMTPGLSAAVKRSRGLFATTPMYLLGQKNGRIRSYTAARDLLRRAAKRAGVEDVGWHDIRAKALTDADAEGKNAQALAAHSTESQTVRYLRGKTVPVVQGPASIGGAKSTGESGTKK